MPRSSRPNPSTATSALLLIGHGTRDPRGIAQFESVVADVARSSADSIVEHGYLELAEPTIADAIARCAARGATHVTLMPLLLFAAGHAKDDIPKTVQRAARDFTHLEFRLAEPLGCHPKLIELSALRFQEALSRRGPRALSDTLLILVGRGSTDTEATREMLRFAQLRSMHPRVVRTEACFLAMAAPSLDDALSRAAQLPYRRVVVQPHLLFEGELSERVRKATQSAAHRSADQEWIVAECLGPHHLLAAAIREAAPGQLMESRL